MANKPLKDLLAIIHYTILSVLYTILHEIQINFTRVHVFHHGSLL